MYGILIQRAWIVADFLRVRSSLLRVLQIVGSGLSLNVVSALFAYVVELDRFRRDAALAKPTVQIFLRDVPAFH